MKILNFGSMNIDYVYRVSHFVEAGETIGSQSMQVHCGGKGLNQSIALAKAGAEVYHAGMAGANSEILTDKMHQAGVNLSFIKECGIPAGHAIIQVDDRGQNCILLYSGSNHGLDKAYINQVLEAFGEGDILLLQNEINELPYILEQAKHKKFRIAFNPSPFSENLKNYPLDCVDIFMLNEIEGEALTGKSKPEEIAGGLLRQYPQAAVLLTLGKDGVYYKDKDKCEALGIFNVKVVDTTAAGDTFTGYFIAGLAKDMDIADILLQATAASSLAVSRMGASDSIPELKEVQTFLKARGKRI